MLGNNCLWIEVATFSLLVIEVQELVDNKVCGFRVSRAVRSILSSYIYLSLKRVSLLITMFEIHHATVDLEPQLSPLNYHSISSATYTFKAVEFSRQFFSSNLIMSFCENGFPDLSSERFSH